MRSEEKLVCREYLRVSKDRYGTGRSPDEQHHDNVEAVKRNGWTMHPIPYRDDDRSASRYAKKSREGFEQLMSDLEENTFGADALVLWESSRGSRRAGEWVDLLDLLAERGVRVLVVTHQRLYDPRNARDRRSLLEDAVDSEYESAKTSERLRRSAKSAAERGQVHGKNLYGYKRIYDSETRQLLRIEPHPEQAPVVREVFRRALAGQSYNSIAKWLNESKIPPRRPQQFKTPRTITGWSSSSVSQLLNAEAYTGVRLHHGRVASTEAVWPPLVSREDWDALQQINASRVSFGSPKDSRAKRLLVGIAQCDECSAWMGVFPQNRGSRKLDAAGNPVPRERYWSYICQGLPGVSGFHVAMKQSHLDHAVTELIIARLSRPDFLVVVGQQEADTQVEREILRQEIAGHQRWLEEVRVKAEATRDLSLLFDQEARVQPKIRAAQERLERLAGLDQQVRDVAGSSSVREAWAKLSLEDQRRIVRSLMRIRVKRVPEGMKGHRGINLHRIEVVWK
ncbi:recombinase family protein [Leucobacter chromiireducens]|uniref:Recombinase family protein n=1 Tax=Leucobacter chromiireducens subsp. solipictus TaxID=398235 RepID=A0ABS1SGG8_9MICO|nr:recombinase family protein [Leucobacter chromiireducens]MBL3679506.1 recombinase family protein [Leucobacter chromiireducens subsp. solipictus]